MKIGQSMFAALVAVTCLSMSGCPSEDPVYPTPTATTPPPVVTAPPVAPTSTACDAMQAQTMAAAVAGRAVKEATGMTPTMSVCANVPEGGSVASDTFYIDASVCYTAIANSMPNVTELDVQLVVDPSAIALMPALAQFAAQPLISDSDVGPMGRIDCYKYQMLIAAPVKMKVTARQGAGVIAGQLFTKKK